VKRQDAEARGRWGERRAAWWMRLHGWKILDTRVKVKAGEVDLVARRGSVIAFVEVKTRATQAELDIAIDAYRLRRVANAVNAIAHIYATKGEDIRIDVMLIAPKARPRWIENAWQPFL
jgi:putative endonuclease